MTESNRIEFKRELTYMSRIDTPLWDERAIHEAVINFIVHNDYSREVPPKFEIFSDRFEITSYGRLPENMSEDEFFNGVSIPRNKELMRIFRDVEMVESLGSGMPRIMQVYGRECFTFMEHFIRFTVPFYKDAIGQIVGQEADSSQKNDANSQETDTKTSQKTSQKTEVKLLEMIKRNPSVTTQEMADTLGIARRNVQVHIKRMQEKRVLRRVGSRKSGHWEIIENKEKTK